MKHVSGEHLDLVARMFQRLQFQGSFNSTNDQHLRELLQVCRDLELWMLWAETQGEK